MSTTTNDHTSETRVRVALARLGIDKDDPRCQCGSECTHVIRHNALHGPPMRVVCDTCIPQDPHNVTIIPREHVKLQFIRGRDVVRPYDKQSEEPI